MNCPNCGGPSAANICENCGTVLREAEPTSSVNTEKIGRTLTSEINAIGKLNDDGKTTPTIKLVAILLAIFSPIPGISTIIIGRIGLGILQIVLSVIGWILTLVIVGFFLLIGIWIWALVLAVKVEADPNR
jgi:TM2 domain-containing membrane protein YozV